MQTMRLVLVILLVPFMVIEAAIPHTHTEPHHDKNHTGERLKDGSFKARDADHHDEDGEHNMEFDHEAILGSVSKAEEFHHLSPDESKRRLRILVENKIDTNKDGLVDKHELKAHIIRSFKSLSEEESYDRFYDIDANIDNYISWDEYASETYTMHNEKKRIPYVLREDADDEQKRMFADDKAMFELADGDKNDLLDREEFVMFISPEEHPTMLPLLLNQTLMEKDRNGDGVINFQEFLGDSGREHDKPWLLAEKERFDHEYDKDHDGVLNGNEILSWVVPSNDDVATDEVNHLFAATDNNQDDRLSYDEIIDSHDLWVGSEATDYGDHLHDIVVRDEL